MSLLILRINTSESVRNNSVSPHLKFSKTQKLRCQFSEVCSQISDNDFFCLFRSSVLLSIFFFRLHILRKSSEADEMKVLGDAEKKKPLNIVV